MKLGGPLKQQCLRIAVTLGPFESKVYTLQLLLGALWKQSKALIHYNCCWAPLKARYFTHYSCKGGPEASASLAFLLTHHCT